MGSQHPKGRNISRTCKSYFNTEKSKQPCLAFHMFYKASQFWQSRAACGGWRGWRGRLAGKAGGTPTPPGLRSLGHRSPAPASAQRPFPVRTQAYRAEAPASSHGHRASRSLSALEPPPAAPRVPPARPGTARCRTRRHSRGQLQRPAPPRRAQRRRSSPRTHSPRQPRAAQRSASSCRRCQPGPSPSGPPWACRDLKFGAGPRSARGAAVRPLPGELRGVPAVLLRSGRAAKAAPWRGEQGSGRKSWRYLLFASCSPQPRGACVPVASPLRRSRGCARQSPRGSGSSSAGAPSEGTPRPPWSSLWEGGSPGPGLGAVAEPGWAPHGRVCPAPPRGSAGLPGLGALLELEMPDTHPLDEGHLVQLNRS